MIIKKKALIKYFGLSILLSGLFIFWIGIPTGVEESQVINSFYSKLHNATTFYTSDFDEDELSALKEKDKCDLDIKSWLNKREIKYRIEGGGREPDATTISFSVSLSDIFLQRGKREFYVQIKNSCIGGYEIKYERWLFLGYIDL